MGSTQEMEDLLLRELKKIIMNMNIKIKNYEKEKY